MNYFCICAVRWLGYHICAPFRGVRQWREQILQQHLIVAIKPRSLWAWASDLHPNSPKETFRGWYSPATVSSVSPHPNEDLEGWPATAMINMQLNQDLQILQSLILRLLWFQVTLKILYLDERNLKHGWYSITLLEGCSKQKGIPKAHIM